MTPGRIVVVGLGPAGVDLMLPAARSKLSYMAHRYVRTTRHPAIDELTKHGLDFISFDERYEAADEFERLYRGIADELVAAASEHGEVCYGVPGNPGVAERTVTLLRDAERRGDDRAGDHPGHLVRGPRLVPARSGPDGLGSSHGRRPELRGRPPPACPGRC